MAVPNTCTVTIDTSDFLIGPAKQSPIVKSDGNGLRAKGLTRKSRSVSPTSPQARARVFRSLSWSSCLIDWLIVDRCLNADDRPALKSLQVRGVHNERLLHAQHEKHKQRLKALIPLIRLDCFPDTQLTTIRTIMHPKPSELGSQAGVGRLSTSEGDHEGTCGVVSFLIYFSFCWLNSIELVVSYRSVLGLVRWMWKLKEQERVKDGSRCWGFCFFASTNREYGIIDDDNPRIMMCDKCNPDYQDDDDEW
jgi:hypothetical protein